MWTVARLLASHVNGLSDDEAARFFDRVADGTNMESGDPRLTLRNVLQKHGRGGRHNMKDDTRWACITEAFDAWLSGRRPRFFGYMRATTEKYPQWPGVKRWFERFNAGKSEGKQ
jgi:hypothetical protein